MQEWEFPEPGSLAAREGLSEEVGSQPQKWCLVSKCFTGELPLGQREGIALLLCSLGLNGVSAYQNGDPGLVLLQELVRWAWVVSLGGHHLWWCF